jgi:hypothetical protein
MPGTGFTTVRVTRIDDRTVSLVGKLGPDPFVVIQMTASADGQTLLFRQRITKPRAQPVEASMTLTRVSSAPPESHAISGRWSKPIEVDFTSFEILGDTLVRKDSQGSSYSAKLDGTEAPYVGRPGMSVSVKLVDDRTLEQIDKQDGKVFLVEHFKVDPDSRVIRMRYEDPRGHVVTQTAHRIEAPASLESPSE